MSRTFKVVGEQLVDRTIDEVMEEIETLAHELRGVRHRSTREQLTSTIMHLAADISVSAGAD
ncbi:protein of unknown function (plasmid) [Paraburkholderia kururiensis]|uniref:hypothetical protein n=1 Tax=Paraburkholderia kururiensis TaxID=984307 RepID=UPI0039A5646B